MIEHYNAFISYKHAPLDSRVAAEIQTQLERFRIPKAIQKQSGIRKIQRIFRDKEELLITSDLNETIEEALNHSDFLIVICSHASMESVWVQREIAFFLKTHSKKQVLTVVVEGEPADVVPQVLREQEVTVTLDSGETETVLMPAEPLSCDYRGSLRKARREELPRLAAAILGCSYDELRQRQRRYRVRRMSFAFAAVAVLLAALSVYYAWSSSQIRKNYMLSLQNQSQYLSAESVALLEQGDRINAMLLALEALPKDKSDKRPVLPEAEYALSLAVNAYISPDANWYAVESAFPHGGGIDDFLVNQEESHLIVLHSRNTFTIWDVNRHEKLAEHILPKGITQGALSSDDHLLILSDSVLSCYDYRRDTLLWQLSTSPYKGTTGFSGLMGLSENEPLAALIAGEYLITIDLSTGQVLEEIPLPTYGDSSPLHPYGIKFLRFSPDNRKLFLHLDGREDFLAVCDLESETIQLLPFDFFLVDDAVFTEDGNIILIGQYRLRSGTYWMKPLYYYEDAFSDVICIAPDGSVLWYNEVHYTEMSVGLGDEVLLFPYQDEDGRSIPAVACAAGEKLVFFDAATGELLRENTYSAAIVTLSLYDTHFFATLTNGMIGQYFRSANLNVAAPFCIDGIDMAWDKEHLFASDSETGTVLLYTYGLHDENWVEMKPSHPLGDFGYSLKTHTAGSTTLLTQSDNFTRPFAAMDSQSPGVISFDPLPEDVLSGKQFIGLTPDGKALLFLETGHSGQILAYVLETDTLIPNYRTIAVENAYVLGMRPAEDALYYTSCGMDASHQMQYAFTRQHSDDTYDRWALSPANPDSGFDDFLLLSPGADAVLLKDLGGEEGIRFYVLDLLTGTLAPTEPFSVYESPAAWASDGSMFFAADENCIRAFDRTGQEVYRLSCNGMTPTSLFCSGEQLLVLYGTEKVYRYQASSGAFLNQMDVDAGSAVGDCRWDDSQPGTLALFRGDTLNLLDTARWVVRAHVDDCLGFSLEEGLILTAQRDEDQGLHLGYYKLYSYEDLIERAKQQLGDTALSPEMRGKYGIE